MDIYKKNRLQYMTWRRSPYHWSNSNLEHLAVGLFSCLQEYELNICLQSDSDRYLIEL
ncbi:hypothetical protein [Coleofasciculus sp. H7-2]|uniref:hypothetical protein n=1 Tax=Coleofasciculus sp. H7-2 TaxID=3351545 RepID=UPI00366DBAF2